MFLNIDKHNSDNILAVDNSDDRILVKDVCETVEKLRAKCQRAVCFNLCNNTVGALLSYLVSVELQIALY